METTQGRPKTLSGWTVGIACGVLLGLWAYPPARNTVRAQLQLAFAGGSVAWMRVLDEERGLQERPRLDSTAAAHPDDYLLQVGRATALVETSRLRAPDPYAPPSPKDVDDRTLLRLGFVARDFPAAPGAYAHLSRYMTSDRIRIRREELPGSLPQPSPGRAITGNAPPVSEPPRSLPARRKDSKLMLWALRSGELRDRDNAFWPAMQAIAYFAALRDNDALAALGRAARKPHWDSFIYEEVLGQWRLYAAAYGDYGATQKIGPLSLIAFPHLRELRQAAELARRHADTALSEGRIREGIRIRRAIAYLGVTLRDKAPWAYEALYGTDIFLIGCTDHRQTHKLASIRTVAQWEQRAQEYIALLKATKRNTELAWLRQEVRQSCELRARVDSARFDSSFPGAPPGIPLAPLFGYWMAGVCVLQQLLALGITALVLRGATHRWQNWLDAPRPLPPSAPGVLLGVTAVTGAFVFFGAPTRFLALVFLAGLVLLLIASLHLAHLRWRQGGAQKARPPAMFAAAGRWNSGTTLRLLLFLFLPALAALILLLPVLSSLHPIAVILTDLLGMGSSATAWDALLPALLAAALPLAMLLAASLWALYRGHAPLAGACIGWRRLALPMAGCLAFTYLAVLSRTLPLDTATSHAINEAAQNESKWVLTHTDANSGE